MYAQETKAFGNCVVSSIIHFGPLSTFYQSSHMYEKASQVMIRYIPKLQSGRGRSLEGFEKAFLYPLDTHTSNSAY